MAVGLGMAASLAAVVGVFLQFVGDLPGVQARLVVGGLCLLAILILITANLRKDTVRRVAGVATALTVMIPAIVLWVDPSLLQGFRRPGPSGPVLDGQLAITVGSATPYCTNIPGTGQVPLGYELWIYERDADDDHWYKAKIKPDAGERWSTDPVEIGQADNPGGTPYTLVAYLTDVPTSRVLDRLFALLEGRKLDEQPLKGTPPGTLADTKTTSRGTGNSPCPQ